MDGDAWLMAEEGGGREKKEWLKQQDWICQDAYNMYLYV